MLRLLFRLVLAALIIVALAIGWFRMTASAREDQTAEALQTDTSRFVDTIHGRIHMMSAGPEDGPPVLLIPRVCGLGRALGRYDDLSGRPGL